MSCDIRGSSVRSCPVWSRGGCTSVVGGDEGGATVVVSTLRSDGLVAGFFFGQPYSTVSSNGAITQINRLWIILGPPLALSEPVGSRGPRGEDRGWRQIYHPGLSGRDISSASDPEARSLLEVLPRPVGHVVGPGVGQLVDVAAVAGVHDVELLGAAAAGGEGDLAAVGREGGGLVLLVAGGEHLI